MSQQGDVLLYQTTDGGEINVAGGLVEMSGGLETMAYLCLFGGNEDDDGLDSSPYNWWGNIDETVPEREYRSETQYLLQSIPATTGNLKRIEEAAERDLSDLVTVGAATEITVTASIPALNALTVSVTIDGDETLDFSANWGTQRADIEIPSNADYAAYLLGFTADEADALVSSSDKLHEYIHVWSI